MAVLVERAQAEAGNIDYLGPVYGNNKDQFFRSIDVLVVPTIYKTEAAPLVCYEALAYGVPVIAFDRGAIAEIIDASTGLLISPRDSFSESAISQLRKWVYDPSCFMASRAAAQKKYEAFLDESSKQFTALFP
jgi:glycosyltransferase involved in cell wall biosynthesis